MIELVDALNVEHRIRRQVKRCGFYVMRPRGAESKRRRKAGVGPYVVLHQATNSVALGAATLDEIAAFLKAHAAQQQRLH
jgi:hypothetical protein